MKAALLVALLSLRAVAAEDAPLTELAVEAPGRLCYSPEQRVRLASHIVAIETENAKLREDVKAAPSVIMVVALSVIALGVGGVIGYQLGARKN